MARQTRIDIAPEVRHKVGLPDDDRSVTDEKVYRDINAALRKMASDFDWPWLYNETTIAYNSGSNSETLPDDFVKMVWASIGNLPLEPIQRRRLQRFSQMTGTPGFYSFFGGNLLLYPTTNSDQTIDIGYIRAEMILADDADQVYCPNNMIDVVYTYAAIETATRLKDAVLRQSLKDDLEDWKRRAADNVKLAKGSYRPQIGRDW